MTLRLKVARSVLTALRALTSRQCRPDEPKVWLNLRLAARSRVSVQPASGSGAQFLRNRQQTHMGGLDTQQGTGSENRTGSRLADRFWCCSPPVQLQVQAGVLVHAVVRRRHQLDAPDRIWSEIPDGL